MLSSSTAPAGGGPVGGSVNGGNGSGLLRSGSQTALVLVDVAEAPEGRVVRRFNPVRIFTIPILGRELTLYLTPRSVVAFGLFGIMISSAMSFGIGGQMVSSGYGSLAVLALYVMVLLSGLAGIVSTCMMLSSHLAGVQYESSDAADV